MVAPEVVFLSDLLAIFSVYLIVNLSLNLEYGYAGIPNFGKVLCVAAGAFVAGTLPAGLYAALLPPSGAGPGSLGAAAQANAHAASHPEAALAVFAATALAALGVGAALGLASAYPAVRLRGEYTAMTLLGLGEVIRAVGSNHPGLVGGSLGVAVPDALAFVPGEYRFVAASLALACAAGAVYLGVWRFTASPVGRLLRASRDDGPALEALGRDTSHIRIKVMVVSGLLAALGGMLYASYVEGVVAYGYNRLNWTFLPFVMVIVGGLASNRGVAAGTLLFVAARKVTLFYNDDLSWLFPFDAVWLDYLLLGGIMIAVLMFRPRGMLPERPGRPPPGGSGGGGGRAEGLGEAAEPPEQPGARGRGDGP